jgi:FkbM family methyltransferase
MTIFQPLKRWALDTARRAGYEIVNRKEIAFGCDWVLDVQRISSAWEWEIKVIFDVGANIGQAAERLSRAFPKSLVFAFEPTPMTAVLLRERASGMTGVKVIEKALGATVGTADLFIYDLTVLNSLNPSAAYSKRFEKSGDKIQCEVTTVDQFCSENSIDQIDLLKIDTEGYDLEVLKGSIGVLSAGLIKFIYVEFNDIHPILGVKGGALAPICELLHPYGFQFISSYTDYVVTEGELFAVCNALLGRR